MITLVAQRPVPLFALCIAKDVLPGCVCAQLANLPHWGRCYLALYVPCLPHCGRVTWLCLCPVCLWGRVTWLWLCPVCLTEVVLPGSDCALFAPLRSCYLALTVPCLPHWGRCYLALSVPCLPHWGRITWLCLCPVCPLRSVLPGSACALFASLRSCYLALSVPLRSMLPGYVCALFASLRSVLPGSLCALFTPWCRVTWRCLCPVCLTEVVLPGSVCALFASLRSVLPCSDCALFASLRSVLPGSVCALFASLRSCYLALSVPCLPHWGRVTWLWLCPVCLTEVVLPGSVCALFASLRSVLPGSVCALFASLRSCYLAPSVPCLPHWGRVTWLCLCPVCPTKAGVTWLCLCPVCFTEVVLPGSVCALFASLRSCYLALTVPCLPHWGRVTWLCLCPVCLTEVGVTWLCLCPVCLTEVVLPGSVCALFAPLRSCYLALSVPCLPH